MVVVVCLKTGYTYSLWSSVLHDDKFDHNTDEKIESTQYGSTCPACSVLSKFFTCFSENFENFDNLIKI